MAKVAVLLAVAACSARHPSKQAPAVGSAADPWSGPAGSALDLPPWAHDSPTQLRDKINGVNADVIVLKSQPNFAEYRDALATAERTPGVLTAEPFIFVEGDLAQGSASIPNGHIKAIDPTRVDRVLHISRHTAGVALAQLEPDQIVLGDGLAKKLAAHAGDPITVHLAAIDDHAERTQIFHVAGTFHMDFDDYDDRLALITLAADQALVGRGDQVMGIEMVVKDVEHADQVAKAIETALGGPPYEAMDWYELNKQLYSAMFGDKRP